MRILRLGLMALFQSKNFHCWAVYSNEFTFLNQPPQFGWWFWSRFHCTKRQPTEATISFTFNGIPQPIRNMKMDINVYMLVFFYCFRKRVSGGHCTMGSRKWQGFWIWVPFLFMCPPVTKVRPYVKDLFLQLDNSLLSEKKISLSKWWYKIAWWYGYVAPCLSFS